jgi:hypothetical protein
MNPSEMKYLDKLNELGDKGWDLISRGKVNEIASKEEDDDYQPVSHYVWQEHLFKRIKE